MDFEHGMSLLLHRLRVSSLIAFPRSVVCPRICSTRRSFRVSVCAPKLYPDFWVLLRWYLRDILLSVDDAEVAAASFVPGGARISELRRTLIERWALWPAHIAAPLSDAIRNCYKLLHAFRALCIRTDNVKSTVRQRMYHQTCNLLAELFHGRAWPSEGRRELLCLFFAGENNRECRERTTCACHLSRELWMSVTGCGFENAGSPWVGDAQLGFFWESCRWSFN